MGILSWILLGLVVGALAKWIKPGVQGGGFVTTTLLGIAGAIVGGWLSTLLGLGTSAGFSIPSLAIAVIGALLVLFVHGKVTGKKA